MTCLALTPTAAISVLVCTRTFDNSQENVAEISAAHSPSGQQSARSMRLAPLLSQQSATASSSRQTALVSARGNRSLSSRAAGVFGSSAASVRTSASRARSTTASCVVTTAIRRRRSCGRHRCRDAKGSAAASAPARRLARRVRRDRAIRATIACSPGGRAGL